MKKVIAIAVVGAAALALSACGKPDDAQAGASPESVEMNADELPLNDASAGAANPPAPEAPASAPAMAAPGGDDATIAPATADDAARRDADSAGQVADAVKAAAANADAENAAKH